MIFCVCYSVTHYNNEINRSVQSINLLDIKISTEQKFYDINTKHNTYKNLIQA